MVRVRVRVGVILDRGVSLICVHRYGRIISEDASLTQQKIGPVNAFDFLKLYSGWMFNRVKNNLKRRVKY